MCGGSAIKSETTRTKPSLYVITRGKTFFVSGGGCGGGAKYSRSINRAAVYNTRPNGIYSDESAVRVKRTVTLAGSKSSRVGRKYVVKRSGRYMGKDAVLTRSLNSAELFNSHGNAADEVYWSGSGEVLAVNVNLELV